MAASPNTIDGQAQALDLAIHPDAQQLIHRCLQFLEEIKDLFVTFRLNLLHPIYSLDNNNRSPNETLEQHLNNHYGPSNAYYKDFRTHLRQGLAEGWIAGTYPDGARHRRRRTALPTPESNPFSIATVYIGGQDDSPGQPYPDLDGEINCVVPINDNADVVAAQDWQRPGWTVPRPETERHPTRQISGGEYVALLFSIDRKDSL